MSPDHPPPAPSRAAVSDQQAGAFTFTEPAEACRLTPGSRILPGWISESWSQYEVNLGTGRGSDFLVT